MIKEEIKAFPKPKLIEDLGMLYPKEGSNKKRRFGIYECGFCGTHFKAMTSHIRNGNTKSCGCYRKSELIKNKTTHGDSNSKLYYIWTKIKGRTSSNKDKDYPNYGGRGITLCEEWKDDYNKFKNWSLVNGYEEGKGLSIDRIDNDKGYSPNNCRWTTKSIQNRNQRMKGNNKSGFKGVCWNKSNSKYAVCIRINNTRVYLGVFELAVEGAIVYNNYIIENNLEGFILNDIPEEFREIIPKRITRK